MGHVAGREGVGHEAEFHEWFCPVGEQFVVNLVDVGKIVDRLTVLVLAVHANFIMEDAMEANIAEIGGLPNLAKIFSVIVAKGENRAAGAEHLLPEVRERRHGRAGIKHNLLRRGLRMRGLRMSRYPE